MQYFNSSNDSSYQITGRLVAHCRRSPARRALLAADLLTGRALMVEPTATQVAALLRVSPTYVRMAIKIADTPGLRSQVEVGRMSLADAAAPTMPNRVAAIPLLTYQPEATDLVALARAVGPDVWLEAAASAGI